MAMGWKPIGRTGWKPVLRSLHQGRMKQAGKVGSGAGVSLFWLRASFEAAFHGTDFSCFPSRPQQV